MQVSASYFEKYHLPLVTEKQLPATSNEL